MLPLVDKPIIQYGVEEAVAAGIEQIIIITSTHKGAIEDHFDLNYELEKVLEEKGEIEKLRRIRAITDLAQLAYVRQKEQLGSATRCSGEGAGRPRAPRSSSDDVVVGDSPCINAHPRTRRRMDRSSP
jgi:UTP--glucose-1-phosphate uridylyltransferase